MDTAVIITANLYENEKGKLYLETRFYIDGKFESKLFVRYNDGFTEEVTNMYAGMKNL